MTPEEFLEQLNPYSKVFDLSVDYKYTEEQLVLFAKLYHENELKKLRVADVSGQLPDFLYEDGGQIKIGYHGDTVVTDEWNKWKEVNLR